MAIDIKEARSPGWWLDRLAKQLTLQRRHHQSLIDRFEGNAPLPNVPTPMRPAYEALQKKCRTNWAELVVRARTNRLKVGAIRTGAAGDELGDAKAAELWAANQLAVYSGEVHERALACGAGYVIIGDVDPRTSFPAITTEDPRQVTTIHDPKQPQYVRAGLKLYYDAELEQERAYVTIAGEPGATYIATRDVRRYNTQYVKFAPNAWDWERGPEDPQVLPRAFDGMVPIVRFEPRFGFGCYENHVDVMDRIDHGVLQRVVIAVFQAARQRAAKGMPNRDPETDELINYDEILTADPGGLWILPPGADLWESSQIDLTPILAAERNDIIRLSAVTFTPLSSFLPDNVLQSAEGATFAREGLVFDCEDIQGRFGESWKDVAAHGFRWLGDEVRADRAKIDVLWESPERRSLAERADAASKSTAGGLPWSFVLRDVWGYTPTEIAEAQAERARDQAVTMSLARATATVSNIAAPPPGQQHGAPQPGQPVPGNAAAAA
jgi:hypothetical protein